MTGFGKALIVGVAAALENARTSIRTLLKVVLRASTSVQLGQGRPQGFRLLLVKRDLALGW